MASVTIWVNFYDQSGAQVSSDLAMIANLAPGQTWKWKIAYYDDSVRSYKIVKVDVDY